MIGIIDYGMGNLHSVYKAFELVGAEAKLVTEPAEIDSLDKLVLPGVGAFRDAIGTLNEKGLIDPIKRFISSGRWFLGICLGFQLLFDRSYESGQYDGLAIAPGEVKRFDFADRADAAELKIPHMGWNSINWDRPVPLFKGLDSGVYVYFVHSYYVAPADESVVATKSTHGISFASSIWQDNILAVQFHPEKSQRVGLKMIRNFSSL